MKLVASMIVRNELGRYLQPCVEALLEFCDEVAILDDASDDGTWEWHRDLSDMRVKMQRADRSTFYVHEGRARNTALQWAYAQRPSHVLAIDADEFVTDGAAIRKACEADHGRGVWSLGMQEVWKADSRTLWLREDGGWKAQEGGIPILWRAPQGRAAHSHLWQVADRKLASGREPAGVRRLGRPLPSGSDILHFGWACEADRRARYDRYAEHDGGRYHRNAHLDSILWTDARVKLKRRPWPAGLDKRTILARANPEPVAA